MTTNRAHARRILDAMTGRWGKPATTHDAARALDEAGLLTPDPTYRSAPLVGMTWDEEDGVPDGYVHLTFRVPETGRGFSAKDTATINLAGTDHAEGGAS